jgi:phosphatidylglycerol lysyltransferase
VSALLRDLRPALRAAAPTLTALAVFGAGVMLLVSGATPSEHTRVAWLVERMPGELLNISHFVSSLLGLVLILLAWGLKQRLEAAWIWSLAVTAAAGLLAILKGMNWEETAALGAVVMILAPARGAFPRHAAISRIEITPGWLLSALVLVAGSAVIVGFSYRHLAYADDLWWRVLANDDAGRGVRATVGLGALLIAAGVWRLVATAAPPPVVGETDPDFARVRAILARAEGAGPEAGLALLGDKRFLFSDSGESFVMFGVRGRSWIALGPPVGKAAERQELLWRFRILADAHAARPCFYDVGADELPDLVDLGFAIQKIGETAVVPLAGFSLEGARRGNLRRAWRKAGEEGLSFEVVTGEGVDALMAELEAVSDAWLGAQPGGDKGFSLGGFVPAYVREFPVAVARFDGRVVAFVSLWRTADRRTVAVDLMRHHPDGPKLAMDYLFVEVLLWAQGQGYETFEFGMAPLAGLSDSPLAPVMSQIGRLVFALAEDLYNFRGVRAYKQKFDPVWKPRYIAAARKWAIPGLWADVGILSSGGVSGLGQKPASKPPSGNP